MIQIFDRNGQFIRRFGNDLESPRAICIDQQGRIIIIESKIMKGTDIYTWVSNEINRFFSEENSSMSVVAYILYIEMRQFLTTTSQVIRDRK